MKLFKKLRKGFTLIELVVVIAVIAILSAVSVVSYVAITNRAKQSADEQAVKQMNTILTANDVMDLKSINDVYAAFKESEIDPENYKPLFKDRYFFWDADANRVVYTDSNYKVLYPENMKDVTKDQHQWYSLTQEMKKAEIKTTDKVTIGTEEVLVKQVIPATSTEKAKYNFAAETPEQLYTIGQELKDAMLATPKTQKDTKENLGYNTTCDGNVAYIVGDVTIELAHDLDFMGAAFNFAIKGNFTLKGHGHKITGVVNNKDFFEGKSKDAHGQAQPEKYGSGIVGYVAGLSKTKRSTVLFDDVRIEKCVFGYSETKGGGVVGYASNADITFNKVVVDSCNMEAFEHSVGGFVGDVQASPSNNQSVSITLLGANKLENCNLKLHEGTNTDKECYGAGYFIGRQVGSDLTIDKTNGSFTQSGNTKTYGSNNKVNTTGGYKSSYAYWDNAETASHY